ncbi:DNA mismatch repair endonuclease MutL [bacterium]|nr:DNA mismatch repair endonuclease MutL [candidate division CSSED10-310 bacterium]
MSGYRIQILPDTIANRIAAGEIIERPASVVRELLDNAIDADSTRIEIEIRGGGKSLIGVRDNGHGIDPDSLLIAFERHATSKIHSLEDLSAIRTLGFRGEALPSIASVSKVAVESYRRGFETGTRLRIEAGRIISVESCSCSPGTRIVVSGLFFNVPVRRKFMRQPRTEYTHILETVIDHALTFPEIHFVFKDDDKTVFDAPAVDKWSARLLTLMGNRFMQSMIPVDTARNNLHLTGYISTPERMQSTARSQRLYVNGRRIRDRIVTQAVYRGYREFLSSHTHPVFILKLDVPPESIDVNVHPAKSEVRFQEPSTIFETVSAIVAHTVGGSLNLAADHARKSDGEIHDVGSSEDRLPLQRPPSSPVNSPSRLSELSDPVQPRFPVENMQEQPWRLIGQAFDTFILFEFDRTFYMVDQHTAHERILFEQLKSQYIQGKIPGQSLLFPVSVELEPHQAVQVAQFLGLLKNMGLGIESFGSNSFLIRSLPEHLKQESPEILLRNIADELSEMGTSDRNRSAERKMLISLSCRRAVKSGDRLDEPSMTAIVSALFSLRIPSTCPHGRPIIITFSREELESRFKR